LTTSVSEQSSASGLIVQLIVSGLSAWLSESELPSH
jgi:hypothetical protein